MAQLTCFKGSWAIYPPFFLWHRWRNSRFWAIYFYIRVWWTDELVDFQIEAKNQEYDIVTKTELEEDAEVTIAPKKEQQSSNI